jgi:hypothetical protein
MNNWYSKNHKVSPEEYRRARDSIQPIQSKNHGIRTKILEFNNNCKLSKEQLVGDKMTDQKEDREFKRLEILIHGMDNPHSADLSCPHSEWMGEDLAHCPGIGEWKCKLQEYWYASDQYGIDSMDYRACNIKEHNQCEVYNKQGDKNDT